MAKPRKHAKPWTNKDLALLKGLYRKGILHKEIAKKLGRTLGAIETMATYEKLSRRSKKKRK